MSVCAQDVQRFQFSWYLVHAYHMNIYLIIFITIYKHCYDPHLISTNRRAVQNDAKIIGQLLMM